MLTMRLLGVVELDLRNFQLTVLERWSERRWFRTVEHEQQRTFTLCTGVGRWHDGDHFVLQGDPRHFRLMELFAAWLNERKLDAFVFAPEPIKYALPPVPFLAPRQPLPRR